MYNIKRIIRKFFNLEDVNADSITDGQGLRYDLGTDKLIPTNLNTWGDITGTLSDQTDLQSELDDKADIDGANVTDFSVAETLSTDTIQLDLTPTETQNIGTIQWDAIHETASLQLNSNVNVELGQNNVVLVKAGEDIMDGDAVYIYGSTGTNDIAYLAYNTSVPEGWAIGIATEQIDNNQKGFVCVLGHIHGINTSAYTEGAYLWLDSTPGAITETRPTAPNQQTLLGQCIRSHAVEGIIYVYTYIVGRMAYSSDTYTNSLINDDVYRWVSANSRFENKPHNEIEGDATVDGTLKVGDIDGGNYSEIESDGTLVFNGDSTVWDDQQVNLGAVRVGSSAPSWEDYKGSEVLAFANSQSNSISFDLQYSHRIKTGSITEFHLHTTVPDNNAGAVEWQLTVSYASIGGTFPTETTITATQTIGANSLDGHLLFELTDTFASSVGISGIALCSLTRLGSDGNDTYANDIYLLGLDSHFLIDTCGSREETSK